MNNREIIIIKKQDSLFEIICFLLYNNYIYKKKGENKLMVQIKNICKEFKTGNLVQKST